MSRDLTKGSVVGNLLAMSIPTMFGMIGQTLYDVVDLMWIGRISNKAVAGVTLFSSIFWLVEVLNEVIGTSSIALITQAIGSGDERKASRVVEQTVAFKALVAIVSAILLYLGLEPALRLFSGDPEVVSAGLASRSAASSGSIRRSTASSSRSARPRRARCSRASSPDSSPRSSSRSTARPRSRRWASATGSADSSSWRSRNPSSGSS
jgi:hypothetical protein